MPITERQEKILNALVREYICASEPISSNLLKQRTGLNVSPATIRNEFQELTRAGYIQQPHTSAGRVPTKKAYKYFAEKFESVFVRTEPECGEAVDFIVRQVRFAHKQMEREMKFMEDLIQTLENDNLFEILNILDEWHKKTKI